MVKGITFVVASNDNDQLKANFLESPTLKTEVPYEIRIQKDFLSAGQAYNDALDKSKYDILVFCHQDVFLPEGWTETLVEIIQQMDSVDPLWAVIGSYGICNDKGFGRGWLYCNGIGKTIGIPVQNGMVEASTLDEVLLVLNKPLGLRFDDNLPNFHLYGTDICLNARQKGYRCYIANLFLVHNTKKIISLPKEFWHGVDYIRRKWSDQMPIKTPVLTIGSTKLSILLVRLKKHLISKVRPVSMRERLRDPAMALRKISDQ